MRTRQQSFTSKYSQSAVLFLNTWRNSFHNLFSAALYIQLVEFNPSSMFWVCLRIFSQNTSRGRNWKDCTGAISHFNAEPQTFSKQPVDILPSPLTEFPPSFQQYAEFMDIEEGWAVDWLIISHAAVWLSFLFHHHSWIEWVHHCRRHTNLPVDPTLCHYSKSHFSSLT